jgi:hypothetical protein
MMRVRKIKVCAALDEAVENLYVIQLGVNVPG